MDIALPVDLDGAIAGPAKVEAAVLAVVTHTANHGIEANPLMIQRVAPFNALATTVATIPLRLVHVNNLVPRVFEKARARPKACQSKAAFKFANAFKGSGRRKGSQA